MCSVRPDFQYLLSNDRKKMILLNYVKRFSNLPTEEQTAIALFFCNVSSQHLGCSWLLYFSKWTDDQAVEVCNAQITASIVRDCLRSYNPAVKKYGIGLAYNLSLKGRIENIAFKFQP